MLIAVTEKTDKGVYEGIYVTMGDGTRRLVFGEAPPNDEEIKSSEESLYRATKPTEEQMKAVFDQYGVSSAQEIRDIVKKKEEEARAKDESNGQEETIDEGFEKKAA